MHDRKKEKKREPLTDEIIRERLREDINALRTAINMQASLLHDLEKTLQLDCEHHARFR